MELSSFRILSTRATPLLPAIHDLRAAVFATAPGQTRIELEQDREPSTVHLLALGCTTPLGCVSLVRQTLEGQDAHRLRALAVAPDKQRQGVGGALVEAAVAAWRQLEGTPVLWLSALAGTTGFYEKHGFVPHGQPHLRPVDGWSQVMTLHRRR